MAGKQQQGQGPATGDNSLDFLWLVGLVVVILVGAWYFYHAQISEFILTIRYYEMLAVQYVLGYWNQIASVVNLPVDTQILKDWAAYIKARPPDVPFSALADASTAVGNYLRYPVIVILVWLSWSVFRRHVGSRFRMTYDMDKLKKMEQTNWPNIVPVIRQNLVKTDLDEEGWGMSLPPIKFCKKYDLIEEDEKDGKPVAKLIRGPASQAFALQLGHLWPGIQATPKHVQALFTIFAAKANHDADTANKLLAEIAKSAVTGKPKFTGYRMAMIKYHNTKLVQRVVVRHAYVSTVMATMLELARTDGVLASSEFIWLKPLDRKLWYMLNTVGRLTAVPEISGAYAHWLAEKQLKRPLRVPMIDSAVKAMEAALEDIIYEPEED